MLDLQSILPPPHRSWNQVLATLPEKKREEILGELSEDEVTAAFGDWFFDARREQIAPPGDWFIWLIMAGRGFGKNWSGAHWLIDQHQRQGKTNTCIVAATASDLRRYCLEGPSGILSLAPRWFYPEYKPSKTKLVWPNGGETHLYTSEKPNRLRGANHDAAWCDEVSYWAYPTMAWDMLMLTLRYGKKPQVIATMTPRPIAVIRQLLAREGRDVVITRGSTYDNLTNLSPSFVDEVINQYEGTRLGRQEIGGELLEDVEGALWNHELLDTLREMEHPPLVRCGIGVDPPIKSGENADLCGIIVGGVDEHKTGHVIADYSQRGTPQEWGRRVARAFYMHDADFVVAEGNQGGEMVSHVIHSVDEDIPVKIVHATKGKVTRAEPISARYEQHKIRHCGTGLQSLEDEMCLFVPGNMEKSPDRVDALVWLMSEFFSQKRFSAGSWGRKKVQEGTVKRTGWSIGLRR